MDGYNGYLYRSYRRSHAEGETALASPTDLWTSDWCAHKGEAETWKEAKAEKEAKIGMPFVKGKETLELPHLKPHSHLVLRQFVLRNDLNIHGPVSLIKMKKPKAFQ